MGSHDLIIFIVISFCYHMLLSLGGLLPLVCDLEPSVYLIWTLMLTLFLRLLPSGGPRRTVDSPEAMDLLPQGQAAMLSAWVWLPLQHAAQCLRPAWPYAAGHTLLRHLWLGVVSIDGLVEDPKANKAIIDHKCPTSLHVNTLNDFPTCVAVLWIHWM